MQTDTSGPSESEQKAAKIPGHTFFLHFFFSEDLVKLVIQMRFVCHQNSFSGNSSFKCDSCATRIHSLATPNNNGFANGYKCSRQDKPAMAKITWFEREKKTAALKHIEGIQGKLHNDWVKMTMMKSQSMLHS